MRRERVNIVSKRYKNERNLFPKLFLVTQFHQKSTIAVTTKNEDYLGIHVPFIINIFSSLDKKN